MRACVRVPEMGCFTHHLCQYLSKYLIAVAYIGIVRTSPPFGPFRTILISLLLGMFVDLFHYLGHHPWDRLLVCWSVVGRSRPICSFSVSLFQSHWRMCCPHGSKVCPSLSMVLHVLLRMCNGYGMVVSLRRVNLPPYFDLYHCSLLTSFLLPPFSAPLP